MKMFETLLPKVFYNLFYKVLGLEKTIIISLPRVPRIYLPPLIFMVDEKVTLFYWFPPICVRIQVKHFYRIFSITILIYNQAEKHALRLSFFFTIKIGIYQPTFRIHLYSQYIMCVSVYLPLFKLLITFFGELRCYANKLSIKYYFINRSK